MHMGGMNGRNECMDMQWSRKQFCFGGAIDIHAGFAFGHELGGLLSPLWAIFSRGPEVFICLK